MRHRSSAVLLLACLCVFAGIEGSISAAATSRACRPVVNPYPNTRYEGINLSRIRSEDIRCQAARRVARRAHAKALGMNPNRNGILRFRWNGWRVVGDLRPPSDRYVARKYGRQVRWRF